MNLIENVFCYGEKVVVRCEWDEEVVCIIVDDDGFGIFEV